MPIIPQDDILFFIRLAGYLIALDTLDQVMMFVNNNRDKMFNILIHFNILSVLITIDYMYIICRMSTDNVCLSL